MIPKYNGRIFLRRKKLKTPAGFECQFFYGDYYRGKNHEECRLIGRAAPPRDWRPNLCKTCSVPIIQRANACEFMQLRARVNPGIIGIGRRVVVTAYCRKAERSVEKPEIGCGLCHSFHPVLTNEES